MGGNKALSSHKAISICIINRTSPFLLTKPAELRPWGQFPSNTIKTNRQSVLWKMMSNMNAMCPEERPGNECSHRIQTHQTAGSEVRVSLKV